MNTNSNHMIEQLINHTQKEQRNQSSTTYTYHLHKIQAALKWRSECSPSGLRIESVGYVWVCVWGWEGTVGQSSAHGVSLHTHTRKKYDLNDNILDFMASLVVSLKDVSQYLVHSVLKKVGVVVVFKVYI